MFKTVQFFAVLFFAVLISGCATIFSGSTQNIQINSDPQNAVVKIDGMKVGKTPLTTPVVRDKNHIVEIETDGYEPFQTRLVGDLNPWFWGNCLFGGLVGMGVDVLTGSNYTFKKDNINVDLSKLEKQMFKKKDIPAAKPSDDNK